MEQTLTTEFATKPMALSGEKLTVHLDKLNAELDGYNLRVNSIDDIFIDQDLSKENTGSVLKIFCTKINDGGWDENAERWFFKDCKQLEDKFESLSEIVSGAEIDRGDLIITLYLNKPEIELNKKFEAGGLFDEDYSFTSLIDEQIKNKPDEVFKMVGMAADGGDIGAAKQKAVAMLKEKSQAPLWVFFHGRKINLAQGPTIDSVYLQTALHGKFYEHAMQNLMGQENPSFANDYANNKSILAVDMIRGLALQKNGSGAFHVTNDVLNDVVSQTLA